jgi:hypothetical protein
MPTMARSVVTAPQPPKTTNVDAVYAPDLSTGSALPPLLGPLAAGVHFPAPAGDLSRKTVI